MIASMRSGSLMRATPPWARMSAGTRSSAMTATAPASSAILAWSAVTTSMMTPPLSISASPRLTRLVPQVSGRGGVGHGYRFYVSVSGMPSAAPGCQRRSIGYVQRPRGRELVAHLAEQPRQRLGARDDREEVRVVSPSAERRAGAGASAMPAPATGPWFMPMLKPSAREVAVSTRMAVWVRLAISAVSAGVASS